MNSTLLQAEQAEGRTFSVADVAFAQNLLPTVKTHQAVATLLRATVEVACDYTDDCVAGINYNPLVAAAKYAHDQHRPLALSPDIIWLTLCQGLSQHIENNWAIYRESILTRPDTTIHEISVTTEDFPFGSPETPWNELIRDAAAQVRQYVKPEFSSLFNADFSTSRSVDQVAFDTALLAAVSNEFQIIDNSSVCGIPEITLTGNSSDWQVISQRIESFQRYGLDWWVREIRSILWQFCEAIEGRIDRAFWSQLYAIGDYICGKDDRVTGWIGKLFPYVLSPYSGASRNCLVTEEPGEFPSVEAFPTGVRAGKMCSQRGTIVNLVGGLVGVSQNPNTMQLKPKIGWAMQRSDLLDELLQRISTSSAARAVLNNSSSPPSLDVHNTSLHRFYRRFNSLKIFSKGGNELISFIPEDQMLRIGQPFTELARRPLLWIGYIAGRYRLATLTCNSDGVYSRMRSYVFPLFLVEIDGEFRFVNKDLETILSYYLDIAESGEDDLPTTDLGPVVDIKGWKQLHAFIKPRLLS